MHRSTSLAPHALRLNPGDDLRQSLLTIAVNQSIHAGFILSAIGSLTQAAIRYADQPTPTILPGRFEILALSGLFSQHGIHLHMAIADHTGRTIGGHVCDGCLIYTTAEIVYGECQGIVFDRQFDPQTGFIELAIHHNT
ncbi:MAG: DNA-binding protein [Cyanobacteria bacterium]|nr:DNA-binding protein [Cyanobacteriota bacterium]MDW8199597.1 DNA-binding protein [Cyanobacteriota bacterium SKYGB_h_bin112]